ncbi:hypothetical protein NC651_019657 [Populus alba x Populus x berolinensis]|nr:hypothetical protein NC651_019657 [Populus alba x Populus x berolinensis]
MDDEASGRRREIRSRIVGPQQFVKDMLQDLCVYNKGSNQQGSYELKPEHKKAREEPMPEKIITLAILSFWIVI